MRTGPAPHPALAPTWSPVLDRLPLGDLERRRVLDEVLRAFAVNTAVFQELAEQFPAAR
ncbi:hypothetical protein OH799_02450 [Nocardia sp. NBC_00881]|uniref:hypothetical protein n=1 Tax=Nocardia sp. NBC_00881 TaxID=2975995 RepID=UPI00386928AD|nr:hypothetical protein OH799_02450 [Nocardia sp. NBC_00881]